MDEPATTVSTETPVRFWRWVLVIALVALGLRVWVVARSEVAARDSINFIRYALRFESEPFTKVLREAEQPPGYPLAVLAASWPVRAWRGTTDPAGMALAAEIASLCFGVLLVIPMALLGRNLGGPLLGLLAAALFQCLPSWIRLTSDGLSESTFLFWSASALWLAARAFSGGPLWTMLGCGLAAGCAYFTRPEGAELVIAAACVLLTMAILRRITWNQAALQTAALVAGFAVFLGPFYATTGRLTNKPTARYLLGDETAKTSYFGAAPTKTLPLAVWLQGDEASSKWVSAGKALIQEVAQSSRYAGLFLALIGLYLWSSRIKNQAAGWMMFGLCVLHSGLLIRMTSALGYLSERHTALLILVGSYPAALAVQAFAERVRHIAKLRIKVTALAAVCILFAFASELPSLGRALHGNRAGHRAAGEWLAKNAPAEAGIRDPFCWANYYAGRVFHETAAADPDEQFVIVENSDNQHSRLPLMPEARAKATAGTMVYCWPPGDKDKSLVRVYHWHRPGPFTNSSPTPPSSPSPAGG
ncbi:MAG: hypothetical protein ACJ8C4_06165 [Gemmataceae bacterium]